MMKLISGGLLASLVAVHLQAAEHDIEEVVVTGPFHKPLAESVLPIGVLSGEELRREAANSLGETLDSQPGVHSASFGPGVGQPVIRGQSGKRVQVLQNSVFVSDAANLSPDHSNGIEPLLADSIEVVRGPATLLYGSGAIGGVVNVIDQRIPTR
ncbi:MAG: iron complex outermembrane receptor protein, partial [Candidatus Azotimanducaceae bacterium]